MVRRSQNARAEQRLAAAGVTPELLEEVRRQLRAVFPQVRASAPLHPPFTGWHHHVHSAFQHESADDDGQHSHPHQHFGDADHGSHDAAHELLTPFGRVTADPAAPDGASDSGGQRYARHVRFEGGGVSEVEQARAARAWERAQAEASPGGQALIAASSDAWARLAASAAALREQR